MRKKKPKAKVVNEPSRVESEPISFTCVALQRQPVSAAELKEARERLSARYPGESFGEAPAAATRKPPGPSTRRRKR